MKKTFNVSLAHFKVGQPDEVQRIEVELPDDVGSVAAANGKPAYVDQAVIDFEFRREARRLFFVNNKILGSSAEMKIVEIAAAPAQPAKPAAKPADAN